MQVSLRIFFSFLLMIPLYLSGQRMDFVMQNNSPEIQIFKGDDLDFDFVIKGDLKVPMIELEAEDAAWVKITAPRDEELEIVLDFPESLSMAQYQIPVNIQASYSNTNTSTIKGAKIGAIELPGEVVTHHIPVSGRQITGEPPQPKLRMQNPNATGDVYIFFYGTAGPASISLPAGTYTGNIFITVSLRNR